MDCFYKRKNYLTILHRVSYQQAEGDHHSVATLVDK